MSVLFELRLEEFIVGVADDIFEKVLLLNLHKTHFEFLLLDKLQILVDGLKSEIHSLRFVVFHKIPLVGEKILARHFLILLKEMRHRPDIRAHGVHSQVLA